MHHHHPRRIQTHHHRKNNNHRYIYEPGCNKKENGAHPSYGSSTLRERYPFDLRSSSRRGHYLMTRAFHLSLKEYGIYPDFNFNVVHALIGVVFAVLLSVISAMMPVRSIRKMQVKDVILNRAEQGHQEGSGKDLSWGCGLLAGLRSKDISPMHSGQPKQLHLLRLRFCGSCNGGKRSSSRSLQAWP